MRCAACSLWSRRTLTLPPTLTLTLNPNPNPHQTLVTENLARIEREEKLVITPSEARRRTSAIEGDVRSSSMPQAAGGQGGEEAEEESSVSGRGEEGFGAQSLGSVELDEEAEKERVDALFFRV